MESSPKSRLYSVPAILLVASILICGTPTTSKTQSNDNTNQNSKEKKIRFTEDDLKVEKVPGSWRLSTMPDLKQVNDPLTPVAVLTVTTFYGQDRYAGRVKVLEAKIQNRSQRLVQSIQLRWTIVSNEEPETILLEGAVPPLNRQIKANMTPIVDIPPIYFNKLVKPLLKNGELSGHFRLIVGVQEVYFADGTRWQKGQQAAFLKTATRAASHHVNFYVHPRPRD